MGHHSKKASQSPPPQAFDLNTMGQLMNNIDLQAMSNMLSGIDVNQIMSMLSKGGQQNIQPPAANASNPEAVPKATPVMPQATQPFLNFQPPPSQPAASFELPPSDPIVLILNSIKPFLPQEKVRIIDDMVKLLGIKLVIDAVFPPAPKQAAAVPVRDSSEDSAADDQNDIESEEAEDDKSSDIN